mgnify:CR=1 FL=1
MKFTRIITGYSKHKNIYINIENENLLEVIAFLKNNNETKFKQLIDIAGVDYPQEEKRFKLVYLFLSHENNNRIKLSIIFEE